MDENLSWKIILVAAIFSLIVMGFVYFFISPRESEYFTEEKTEKIAEFKQARVSGRKEGKKIWEFYAEEGWSSKNREVTHLYNVSRGIIYHDGKIVVSDLHAPYARAYRRSEMVEVFGHPEDNKKGPSRLKAWINLGRISRLEGDDKGKWYQLKADFLKYVPAQKQTELSGDITLFNKNTSIATEKVLVDHDKDTAEMPQRTRLEREDGILYSDSLLYWSEDERLQADGHVNLDVIEGKLETKVNSDRAFFYADVNRDMKLQGNLEVIQGKKLAVAEEGIYSQRVKDLHLKGKVKAVFEKAGVILKEKSVENLKSPEAKKILKEKTVLTSGELIFSTRTGDANASGSVFVTQKGREAKADRAVYNEQTETIILTGNVFLKKKEEWVSAKKIIISVKDETFEAEGAVEAEFKL